MSLMKSSLGNVVLVFALAWSASAADPESWSGVVNHPAAPSVPDPGMAGRTGDDPGRPQSKPSFQQADANRDGKISGAELNAFRRQDVLEADANRDGALDEKEFRKIT